MKPVDFERPTPAEYVRQSLEARARKQWTRAFNFARLANLAEYERGSA